MANSRSSSAPAPDDAVPGGSWPAGDRRPQSLDRRPYRPNVGIALFAPDGRVLIARRIGDDGPETVTPRRRWQMPQGGVDPGEDLDAAARRELWEETGVTSAVALAWSSRLRYDFPPYHGPPHRLATFRGQEQVWRAMRFLGEVSEIDVASARGGAAPEFDMWRWEHLDRVADLVVPFRRAVYRRVAQEFRRFGRSVGTSTPAEGGAE